MNQTQHHQRLIDLASRVYNSHLNHEGQERPTVHKDCLMELGEYLARECPKPKPVMVLVEVDGGNVAYTCASEDDAVLTIRDLDNIRENDEDPLAEYADEDHDVSVEKYTEAGYPYEI